MWAETAMYALARAEDAGLDAVAANLNRFLLRAGMISDLGPTGSPLVNPDALAADILAALDGGVHALGPVPGQPGEGRRGEGQRVGGDGVVSAVGEVDTVLPQARERGAVERERLADDRCRTACPSSARRTARVAGRPRAT
ncbi:hypothetical protein GCM10011574_06270 [Microbispora bryophytorum]|uniref:Uncharacterized protein n=1 Tax=Microbispora bryophytorum TaxID=1460882 RepID=A0A8H9LBB0_9ACTN|nr:hypothetical protein GCM10011574_06270 [Microbispora bryophytorum]